MTAPLKFNFKGRVEVETTGAGDVVVTSGDGYFYQGHEVIIMSDLKKHFTPANCEAVILMEKIEGLPVFVKQAELNGKVVSMPEIMGRVWDQMPKNSEKADYTY